MDNQNDIFKQVERFKNKLLFDIDSEYIQDLEHLKKQFDGYCSRIRLEGQKLNLDSDLVEREVDKLKEEYNVFETKFCNIGLDKRVKEMISNFSDEFNAHLAVLKDDLEKGDISAFKKHYAHLKDNFNDNVVETYDDELREEARKFQTEIKELEDLVVGIEEKKEEKETEKKSIFDRIKGFFVTPISPYNGQEIELEIKDAEIEPVEEEKTLLEKIQDKFNKNPKIKKIVCGTALAAFLLGVGGCTIQKLNEDKPSLEQTELSDVQVELSAENDQELQINNVYDLTAKFMNAGYDLSAEKVNDWYILSNIQGMDDKTYAKLMKDSKTDSARMYEHFNEVNVAIGDYYSKNVDSTLDVYKYVLNASDSAKIKETEEAIMSAKKGDNSDLKELMLSRVTDPVAVSSHGATEMTIINMFYQQTDTYNKSVIGQDVMDLYNNEPACEKLGKMTFLSVAGSELHESIDKKEEARLTYEGTEKATYDAYFATLTDAQNDNKVYIEETVANKIKAAGIVVAAKEKVTEVTKTATTTNVSKGIKKATTTTQKTVVKAPTTEAEKKVQQKFEAEQDKKAKEEVKNVVEEFAEKIDGEVAQTDTKDYVIKVDGKQEYIVKEDGSKFDNIEMLDEKKEGIDWFKDYQSYKDANKGKVEKVDGVGTVVVEKEEKIDLLPGFHYEGNKIIQDSTGEMVLHGDKETVDLVVDSENSKYENTDGWHIIDESDITIVSVDDEKKEVNNTATKVESTNKLENTNKTEFTEKVEENKKDESSSNTNLGSGLTDEELKELEAILNAGTQPKPNEVVKEDIVTTINGYAINDLIQNPSLCANIPESLLKQYPEVWQAYQNWLNSQVELVQTDVTKLSNASNTSEKIKALEEVKAEVVNMQAQTDSIENVQEETKTK